MPPALSVAFGPAHAPALSVAFGPAHAIAGPVSVSHLQSNGCVPHGLRIELGLRAYSCLWTARLADRTVYEMSLSGPTHPVDRTVYEMSVSGPTHPVDRTVGSVLLHFKKAVSYS